MNLPAFAHPVMLLSGLAAGLALLLLFRFLARKRRQRLSSFASPRMAALLTASLSPARRRIKSTLLALAVFACFATLAGPRYGSEWIKVQQKGIDILIGLDASRSMLATDMEPNRLTRARLAIRDFVTRLTGDRIGLLPFAGTTFLMCPLTTDYDAFLRSLDAIEPDLLPRQGTDLAAVINQARQLLARENNHRILVLITDGEDLSGEALTAAQKAADDGVTVYTVGVGTSQGELIPDPDRPGIFLKDEQGSFVRSRLDEKTLRQIAKSTGGIYVPLGRMGQGLMRIYQEKLKLVPAQEHQERREQRPIERFYWPLAVALFLFLAEFLIGERRKKGATNRAFLARLTDNTSKLLIVCILLMGRPVQANGLTTDQIFHQGRLEEAGKKYRQALAGDPDNPALHYNLGDVLYQQKQYGRAAAEFTKGLASDDLTLQAKSYFNLGDSHFQMAAAAGGKLDSAEKEYRQAIQAYEASLALNPDDADARANLELARKKLQQIQKKQKNRENKGKQKKENKDKKKNEGRGQQSPAKEGQQQQNGHQPDQGEGDQEKKKENQAAGPQSENEKNTAGQPEKTKKDQDTASRDHEGSAQKQEEKPTPQPDASGTAAQQQHGSAGTDQDGKRQQNPARARQAGSGTMTREEARALLESLRDQEGLPVYVPAPAGADTRTEKNRKNW